ncbi:hypothetical protein CDD83_3760 [Cordyceps sp. RAO-2017]|nr:hypothetical protein CDD83_3760 [Cordyceps sp. RAO-2017]
MHCSYGMHVSVLLISYEPGAGRADGRQSQRYRAHDRYFVPCSSTRPPVRGAAVINDHLSRSLLPHPLLSTSPPPLHRPRPIFFFSSGFTIRPRSVPVLCSGLCGVLGVPIESALSGCDATRGCSRAAAVSGEDSPGRSAAAPPPSSGSCRRAVDRHPPGVRPCGPGLPALTRL